MSCAPSDCATASPSCRSWGARRLQKAREGNTNNTITIVTCITTVIISMNITIDIMVITIICSARPLQPTLISDNSNAACRTPASKDAAIFLGHASGVPSLKKGMACITLEMACITSGELYSGDGMHYLQEFGGEGRSKGPGVSLQEGMT